VKNNKTIILALSLQKLGGLFSNKCKFILTEKNILEFLDIDYR